MTSEPETLTQLVVAALANGLTYRALELKAVDPDTGERVGRTTLWKVSKGQDIQVTPSVVRAVAASIGVSPHRAQRAAAAQYIGYYIPEDTAGGTVLREPDAPEGGLLPERDLIKGWDKRESDRTNE